MRAETGWQQTASSASQSRLCGALLAGKNLRDIPATGPEGETALTARTSYLFDGGDRLLVLADFSNYFAAQRNAEQQFP